MRNLREDVRPGDQWCVEQDMEPKIITVVEVKSIPIYGTCVFWDDGSWSKIDCLMEEWAKPLGPCQLDWDVSQLENAIMARLIPLKETGLEVDNPIVAKEMAKYANDLARMAYFKGINASKN